VPVRVAAGQDRPGQRVLGGHRDGPGLLQVAGEPGEQLSGRASL
jgi:hypothetical protein